MHLRSKLLNQTAALAAPDGAGSPAPEPAPVAGTPLPASPASPEPGAPLASAPAPVPGAVVPEPKPAAPKEDWRDARIAELTAKLNKAKLAAPAAVTPAAPAGPTEAEIAARVQTEAQRLAQQAAWDSACNAVASEGNKKFPDFGERLKAVQGVINAQDEAEVAQYNEVLSAAIETGHGAAILHSLGSTPGEVTRLMRLSPVKRAMEIGTMAAKLVASGASPEPSDAPKPITPLGSRGVHYDGIKPDDPTNGTKLPTAEWMKQREKQAEERRMQ